MNVIKCFGISISLHVNLYKCKQSHVSDVLDVRMASIGKNFQEILQLNTSLPRPLSISKVLISYVPCFKFYISTYRIALKL